MNGVWPTFGQVLTYRKKTEGRYRNLADCMQARHNAEILTAYARTFPKRRKPAEMRKAFEGIPEEAKRINDRWMARATRVSKYRGKVDERTKPILRRLARDICIVVTEEPLTYHTTWRSTYSTQGSGAEKYARESAGLDADKARLHGLRANVVRKDDDGPVRFEVQVWTDEAGLELLRDKPEIPMRDWLKACWGRGVNPRVYYPFLPHGIEEKLCVDFMGNDAFRPIRRRTRVVA